MSTKKEEILKLVEEGKTIQDLVQMGYNKKYIKEVLRSLNNKGDNQNKARDIEENIDIEDANLIAMQKDINEIKKFLRVQDNMNLQSFPINSKIETKKKQLEETIKILNFINNNEQLLNYICLNINISISDNSENARMEKVITQRLKDNVDIKVNPVEIFRQKGEHELKNILSKIDINGLKDIARQYTPDARGYVYKWNDTVKIIDYIIERAGSLSEKGSVFVTE